MKSIIFVLTSLFVFLACEKKQARFAGTQKQLPKAEAAKPAPPKAPQKGSFTAWAEPAKPAAFEDYVINVKVKLPKEKMAGYSQSDLSGKMSGTDGYSCVIDAEATPKKTPKNGGACMDMSFDADPKLGAAMLTFKVPALLKDLWVT